MLKCLFLLMFFNTTAHAGIKAKSYIVTDMDGTVIMEQAADEKRAIASITKLITSENALQQSLEELITITKDDVIAGHMQRSPLRAGVSYSRGALVELALISSDNIAAIALGRSAPTYIVPKNTTIVEASGLNPGNVSSARVLAEYARSLHNTEVASTSIKLSTDVGNITKHSTNPLLEKHGWEFFLSKTGYISQSGGCLVVITKIKEELLTIVILGSSNTKSRWQDLAELRKTLGDSDFFMPITKTKRVSKRVSKHIKKRKKIINS